MMGAIIKEFRSLSLLDAPVGSAMNAVGVSCTPPMCSVKGVIGGRVLVLLVVAGTDVVMVPLLPVVGDAAVV